MLTEICNFYQNVINLNITERNKCRNCGQEHKKRHLVQQEREVVTAAVVKVFSLNIAEVQPEQNPKLSEQEIHRTSPQDNPELKVDLKDFSVLIIDNDNQVNAIKDRIEGGIITAFSHEGLELKKTLMVSMGNLEFKSTKKYQEYKIVNGLNQFNKFIPNLASSSTPFSELIQKKKVQLVGCTSRCVREK